MRGRLRALVVGGLGGGVRVLTPPPHEPPKRIEVVPGVHLFITTPYGDVELDGNSVAILSSEGVVHRVYDELAGPLSDAITPPPQG